MKLTHTSTTEYNFWKILLLPSLFSPAYFWTQQQSKNKT